VDDGHGAAGDAQPLGEQPAERLVGAPLQGGRADANYHPPVALADDLIAPGPGLQPDLQELGNQNQPSRSTTIASPWPPATHIVSSPTS
jgi:hypothetical protein